MNSLFGIKIAYVMTGSFCTFNKAFRQAVALKNMGAELIPVMSSNAYSTDTRFGLAKQHVQSFEEICGRKVIATIEDAEPLGPENMADILIVSPCTGNTLSKLALGVTDSPATMAVKSHIRNAKPAVIAVSTNDALAGSFKNIGLLMNTKNYYFVPMSQDDFEKKPSSLIADYSLIPQTLEYALQAKQIQPVFRSLP